MDNKDMRILQLQAEIGLIEAKNIEDRAILTCQLAPGFIILEFLEPGVNCFEVPSGLTPAEFDAWFESIIA